MTVQRKNVRDILIRSDDDHASRVAIDAAHREDVVAVFAIGAEDFFVVAKSVASLRWQKQGGHRLDGELAMVLLEHSTDIDH